MGLGHCLEEQSPQKFLVGQHGGTMDLEIYF